MHESDRQPGRGSVLVVEDDTDTRTMIAAVLEADGLSVVQAATAADAVSFLESGEVPCAILVDMLMPGILGTSLLAYLAHDPAFTGVPVAVVTGSPDLAPPGYPVFVKPLDATALRRFVNTRCLRSPATSAPH